MIKWRLINEAFDFGFKVGDQVELIKDNENVITHKVIPSGTKGEIVAVDKPMRGLMKVKLEDGKVANIPVRSLKKQGEDEPEWKARARARSLENPPIKPKVEPEKPWDYYMRPTSYGSPRYTGD